MCEAIFAIGTLRLRFSMLWKLNPKKADTISNIMENNLYQLTYGNQFDVNV